MNIVVITQHVVRAHVVVELGFHQKVFLFNLTTPFSTKGLEKSLCDFTATIFAQCENPIFVKVPGLFLLLVHGACYREDETSALRNSRANACVTEPSNLPNVSVTEAEELSLMQLSKTVPCKNLISALVSSFLFDFWSLKPQTRETTLGGWAEGHFAGVTRPRHFLISLMTGVSEIKEQGKRTFIDPEARRPSPGIHKSFCKKKKDCDCLCSCFLSFATTWL